MVVFIKELSLNIIDEEIIDKNKIKNKLKK